MKKQRDTFEVGAIVTLNYHERAGERAEVLTNAAYGGPNLTDEMYIVRVFDWINTLQTVHVSQIAYATCAALAMPQETQEDNART